MKTEYNYEDQSLLLAIKNGNEKAFDTLFRKYYPMLCAYGNKFVELEDAEECVQDAMLWLWENKDMLVIETVHIRRERGGLMNASSFCYQFRIFSLIRSRWERKIFGGEDNM